jgi:SAM-dependent methyltransferase
VTGFERGSERSYYDSFFDSAEARALDRGAGFRALRAAQAQFIARQLRALTSAQTILSIGCGNGAIEQHLIDPRWQLVAFDLSFAGPALGRRQTRGQPGLSFAQAAAWPLPVRDDQFDGVLALSVLHHLTAAGRERALREAHRVLRPGGWFIAYDPSRWRALRLAKWLVRRRYDLMHSPDEEELNPREMQQLAAQCGFAPARLIFFDYFIDPLTWLFPAMPPGLFRVLYRLDRMLVQLPGRQLASNFFLIAQKPSAGLRGCP